MHRSKLGAPHLAPHERVLLRESAAHGAQRVGTEHALYIRGSAAAHIVWTRIGWGEVSSVGWARTTATMTLHVANPAGRSEISVPVREHSRLPQFAAERVTACHVASRQIDISAACTATLSAHRDPAGGEITWLVGLDGCGERDAPAIEQAVAEVRAQFGC
jgi:hypothetical protein